MMRLNISAWSIRHPIPASVLFIVLVILGILSFRQLPVTRFPNIDIPVVSVNVTQAGAAPSELQSQVTKNVEDAVSGLSGVKHVLSTISEGVSTTTVEFRLETDSDRAVNDVKDAVARIRGDLPAAIDEPVVRRLDMTGLPIVTYAASAPAMTPEELSWFVDDVVARAVQGLPGVGGVNRIGGVEREIQVTLAADRLLALGITAAEVNRQLRATAVDLSGGRGTVGAQEQTIRTLGTAGSLAELAATTIALPGGRRVRLDEIAAVADAAAEPRTFARFDGEPVVAFAVSRATGASDVSVAEAVAGEVERLAAAHSGVRFALIDSSVEYTYGNYERAMETLIEGAALAVIVVFLFLRDWRATLIAAVTLPLSVIPAFWAMDALGFSLNMVSLLAVTIVTGILVDDAIVEIENIVRHMRMGKSPYRAALEAADEIGQAVIAISLTIVAVFLPVSFMGGIAGQYFKQFGLTVAIAVIFSLLVARLITPVLAAYFMRSRHRREERDGWAMRAYTGLVAVSVRHKFLTLALGLAFFAASFASTGLLPSGFLPEGDAGRSVFVVELPPGSQLRDTETVTAAMTARLRRLPEVRSVFVDGGRQLPGRSEIRLATLIVNYVPKEERTLSQMQLEARIGALFEDIPDIRFWALGSNGQRSLSLIVGGPDQATVLETAARLRSEMAGLPNLANVMSTAPLDRPEIRIRPKPELAAELGVSTAAIAETIRVATIGDAGANLPKFSADGRQIPIRVQLPESDRSDLQLLQMLKVPAQGGSLPLSAVADFELGQGPTAIERYDRALRVALEADLRGTDALGDVLEQIYALPAARNLPAGVTLSQSGDAEIMTEVFDSFGQAMGAGILMVLALLVLLFGNLLQPFTILLSLPLSIGGAILALLLADRAISLPVVIGFLMLMGVVTKNAIMLVDFAVEEMGRGTPRREAVIEAGRKRARPIVMTTIAMVAGMTPSALGVGAGGEFRSPMAIAVIGGLIASTVLSLLFVPAFFVLVDDLSRLSGRLFGRFVGPVDEPAAAAEWEPAPNARGAERERRGAYIKDAAE